MFVVYKSWTYPQLWVFQNFEIFFQLQNQCKTHVKNKKIKTYYNPKKKKYAQGIILDNILQLYSMFTTWQQTHS